MRSIIALLSLVPLADGAVCQVKASKQQQAPQLLFVTPSEARLNYYPVNATADSEDLKEIKLLLQQILAELKGSPPAPAEQLSMKIIAVQACAKCHTEGAAEKDFAIVSKNGELMADLSRGDKRAIYGRVMIKPGPDGKFDKLHMPPGRALSPQALKIIEDWSAGR